MEKPTKCWENKLKGRWCAKTRISVVFISSLSLLSISATFAVVWKMSIFIFMALVHSKAILQRTNESRVLNLPTLEVLAFTLLQNVYLHSQIMLCSCAKKLYVWRGYYECKEVLKLLSIAWSNLCITPCWKLSYFREENTVLYITKFYVMGFFFIFWIFLGDEFFEILCHQILLF